jgi:hypothetical protein
MKKLYFLIPILFLLASCGPSDEEIAQERKHKRDRALYKCHGYSSERCTSGKPLYGYRMCYESTVKVCMQEEGYYVKMREADPNFLFQ